MSVGKRKGLQPEVCAAKGAVAAGRARWGARGGRGRIGSGDRKGGDVRDGMTVSGRGQAGAGKRGAQSWGGTASSEAVAPWACRAYFSGLQWAGQNPEVLLKTVHSNLTVGEKPDSRPALPPHLQRRTSP